MQNSFPVVLEFLNHKKALVEKLIGFSEMLLILEDRGKIDAVWGEQMLAFRQFQANERGLQEELKAFQAFFQLRFAGERSSKDGIGKEDAEELEWQNKILLSYPERLESLMKRWLDVTERLEIKWQKERDQLKLALKYIGVSSQQVLKYSASARS